MASRDNQTEQAASALFAIQIIGCHSVANSKRSHWQRGGSLLTLTVCAPIVSLLAIQLIPVPRKDSAGSMVVMVIIQATFILEV